MDKNPREFEDIAIPVPWGHIAGRWCGKKNVRPILAMHGWLNNYGTWDTLIPLLPPHIGILAIDMPGHGKSSRRPEGVFYHADNYVGDIIRVMQAFEWDKVSIMAHSMSSMFAFVFAALYPNRVDMLIQIDALHPYTLSLDVIIKEVNEYYGKFLSKEKLMREQSRLEPPAYPMDEVLQRVHVGSGKSIDLDKCIHTTRAHVTKSQLYPDKYYFSLDPRLMCYMGFHASVELLVAMARRIKIPHLLIKATRSNFVDLKGPVLDAVRKTNPYFELYIVDGTHHLHLNNAHAVSIHVRKFLSKWMPSETPESNVQPQPQICPMKPHGLVYQKSQL